MSIELRDLSFSYGTHDVLHNINFSAEPGDLVGVLGPNGVGKSTMFRCMLGFFRHFKGDILIDGVDIRTMSNTQMAQHMAYIPQSTVPVYNYTVLDMVLMGTTGQLKMLSSPGRKQIEAARAALDSLGISYLADRGFGQISGGERQLVLIARAVVQNAKILIMDEPTANLDYGNQFRVMEHVQKLTREGYTILLSTHNPEHALLFANQVLILQKGRVLAAGNSGEVLTQELLSQLYGIDVRIHTADHDGRTYRICMPVGSHRPE